MLPPLSLRARAGDPQVASPAHEKLSDNNETSRIMVRLRHRAPLVPAEFDGETLYFENEIKRPASGQSAVLYDGEVCLGGGIIA